MSKRRVLLKIVECYYYDIDDVDSDEEAIEEAEARHQIGGKENDYKEIQEDGEIV